MTSEIAIKTSDRANELRREGAFVGAGDKYVSAAHEYFGAEKARHALEHLFYAILCYRLAPVDDDLLRQKRTYCEVMGVEYCRCATLESTNESAPPDSYEAVKPGVWHEFAGDLYLANGNEQYEDEYRAARRKYEPVSDFDLSIVENEHIRLFDMYQSVVMGVGETEAWDTVREMQLHYNDGTVTDWLSHKTETLPECVDTLVKGDKWIWRSEQGDQ